MYLLSSLTFNNFIYKIVILLKSLSLNHIGLFNNNVKFSLD